MIEPLLEDCDTSEEDATLYVISQQLQLDQRVSGHAH